MRTLALTILAATLALSTMAQTKEQSKECITFLRKGNTAYKRKDYSAAEDLYRHALAKDSMKKEAVFNLGVALQQQNKQDEALRQYEKAANLLSDKTQKAAAYHNIGNAYCVKKQWEQAIDNYKKALRMAPNDMDTKYNLAYAQSKLQKEQEQNKQQQKQQQQNQKDKQDDKNKQQPQDPQDKKGNNQNKSSSGEGKDQQKRGEQPIKMSKEEAQRLLDAIKNQENKVQERMSKKKEKAIVIGGGKDW
jgi:tetratricopeptide (TPR) repeat protein